MPTLLDLMGIEVPADPWDGNSLVPRLNGQREDPKRGLGLYLTEATWMRKHGWRTTEWKLIEALEPDFHFKPPVELYDLIRDPEETVNLADERPDVVQALRAQITSHIQRREHETARPSPIHAATDWHGLNRGPFSSSEDAYTTLHIGSIRTAQQIQDQEREAQA